MWQFKGSESSPFSVFTYFLNPMLELHSALFVHRQSRIIIVKSISLPLHLATKMVHIFVWFLFQSVDNRLSHSIQLTKYFDHDINSLAVGGVVVLFSSFLPDSFSFTTVSLSAYIKPCPVILQILFRFDTIFWNLVTHSFDYSRF